MIEHCPFCHDLLRPYVAHMSQVVCAGCGAASPYHRTVMECYDDWMRVSYALSFYNQTRELMGRLEVIDDRD